MADEIRIGIIGVGIIGKHHIRTYQSTPGVRIVAACDIDRPELARVAEEFGIPHTFRRYRDLLKLEEIDAVDVCLHNNLHAPVAIAALEAGKHVYCEKPMAGSYVDAKAMLDTAKSCGRMLHIQLATLFSAEHKTARRMVSEGHLGHVYYARSFGFRRRGRVYVDGYATADFVKKRTAAGGAMYDMGVYHIAQVLDLLGNPEIVTVTGSTYQEVPMYEAQAKESGYNVEELGLGFARLAGGITLDIEESWAVHYDDSESSKVLGSLGGLKLRPLTLFSRVGDVETSASVDVGIADSRWHRWEPDYDAYDGSQQHWAAALRGRVPLYPTAEIALNVMLISEGVYQSQKLKHEVTHADIVKNSKSLALKV